MSDQSQSKASTSVAHASDPGLVFSLKGENSSKLYLSSCAVMIGSKGAGNSSPVRGEERGRERDTGAGRIGIWIERVRLR
jgi:hypothetical protein